MYGSGYWARRGVPSLKPSFPFGNIKDIILMNKTIGEAYDQIYKQFKGHPYVGFYKLGKPALMVRHPELVKAVLIKNFDNFHDNDFHVDIKVDPILGLNPFNAKGDKWKSARGVVTPSLSVVRVKPLVPQIIQVCRELLAYLELNEDKHLEMYELAGKYTTDVVARCAYGVLSNSFSKPDSEFRRMSRAIFEGGVQSNYALLLAFYAPKIGQYLKIKIISREVERFFIGLVKEIVDYRTKYNVTREDFLQSLIENVKKKNGCNANGIPEYNYVEMAAHCMTFFLDGFETAGILIAYTTYELSLNPEVQERLRQEIASVSKDYSQFTFNTIHSLSYLEAVISESLRKHPPGTTTTRVCTSGTRLDCLSGDGVDIDEGVSVVLPMYSIHNDPEHFPQPHIFNPNRFMDKAKASRHPYAYFPFGAGPRSCPGFRFALSMVKMSVITILLKYRIEPKQPIPTEELELDRMNSFFHVAKDGLWVKFKKLDPEELRIQGKGERDALSGDRNVAKAECPFGDTLVL